MNFQILGICSDELVSVLAIVRFVLNAICIAIPIILIVLIVLDLAKIVTAGEIDDKLKKEVTNKIVARLIFAVLIFLVPTIIKFIFGVLPLPDNANTGEGGTWRTCWDEAANGIKN